MYVQYCQKVFVKKSSCTLYLRAGSLRKWSGGASAGSECLREGPQGPVLCSAEVLWVTGAAATTDVAELETRFRRFGDCRVEKQADKFVVRADNMVYLKSSRTSSYFIDPAVFKGISVIHGVS